MGKKEQETPLSRQFLKRYKGLYSCVSVPFNRYAELCLVFSEFKIANGLVFFINQNKHMPLIVGIVKKELVEKSLMNALCAEKYPGSRFGYDLVVFKEKKI